jgi:hypothetical protein
VHRRRSEASSRPPASGPLVPEDRKAARLQSRSTAVEERARLREALNTGEERYLPLRDKGPNRRYIRQFVDARWNLASS